MEMTSYFTQFALLRQVVDKPQNAFQVLQASLYGLLSSNDYLISENIS